MLNKALPLRATSGARVNADHEMKKWIIVLAVLIALLGGGFAYLWWGPPKLRLVAAGDRTAAFASDLCDFVLQNNGRLPDDWGEFERLEAKASGNIRWTATDTSKRLRILSEPNAVVDGVPRFIEVIDRDIKGMESHINHRIEQARLSLKTANQETGSVSLINDFSIPALPAMDIGNGTLAAESRSR